MVEAQSEEAEIKAIKGALHELLSAIVEWDLKRTGLQAEPIWAGDIFDSQQSRVAEEAAEIVRNPSRESAAMAVRIFGQEALRAQFRHQCNAGDR